MSTRRLFIAGATGAVGATLVRKARAFGVDVVPHARPGSAAKLSHPAAAVFELADAKLVETLRGCTTVVQCIGTMRSRFGTGDTYETSDVGTTRRLVEAAKAAGTIDQFVLLSSVGAGDPLGAYLKAKAQAEALVRDSGLPFTIVRPSAFQDREGVHLGFLRALAPWLGIVKYRPITLNELATTMLYVASQRASVGEVLEGATLWFYVNLVEGR